MWRNASTDSSAKRRERNLEPEYGTDALMGRPRSPHGYRLSALNATKHALFTEDVLTSRGSERCPFSSVCAVLKDDELAGACVPGEHCPAERAIHDAYIEDARRTFVSCRQWLSEQQLEETIAELDIVTLLRQRLSALIARDGITRPKVHPVSGLRYGLEASLAAGRYATTLDNRFNALMQRVLVNASAHDGARLARSES